MKKFNFTLSKMLEYKCQVLDTEKTLLSKLHDDRNKHILYMKQLDEQYEGEKAHLRKTLEEGSTPQAVILLKNHIRDLEKRIEDAKNKLVFHDKRVDQQTGVVVSVNTEISSLEKLKEKQQSEYNYKAQKSEELFIEEFVSNASATN